MPMIQLTAPTGALPRDARERLQHALATTLLKWEGAPDTAFFRAQAWSYFVELPEGAQSTAEDTWRGFASTSRCHRAHCRIAARKG